MNPPISVVIIPERRQRHPQHVVHGGPFAWVALFIILVAILVRQDAATSTAGTPSVSIQGETDVSIQVQRGLERGKPLGDTITAQDLHQAYREIQQEYHAKAFDSKNWITLNSKGGIDVSLLHHSSDPDCPYIKMTAIMPASPQDCWNFLSLANWDKTMPHMDPFYEGVSVYKSYQHRGVGMTLARKRTKRLLAFGKRDFFFVSVADVPKKDGTLVSGTVSVIAPQLAPRQTGYTRAFQDSIAFYEPIDSGEKTQLTIICRIDLNDSAPDGEGGFMPMWLYVKTIGATGARSVLSMRNYLERELLKEKPQALLAGAGPKRRLASFLSRRRGEPKV